MQKKGLFGITSTIVMALSLLITWFAFAANENKSSAEMALNQETGTAYELNRDEDGTLWISDYDADEVWQVDPARGVYTIYHGIDAPSDARHDGFRIDRSQDQLGGGLDQLLEEIAQGEPIDLIDD